MTQTELNQIKDELKKISPWPKYIHKATIYYMEEKNVIRATDIIDVSFFSQASSRIDALIKEVESLKLRLWSMREKSRMLIEASKAKHEDVGKLILQLYDVFEKIDQEELK